MTPLPSGSRLGPYRIVELIGAGGMGAVYRARDDRLQRDVAIKVLLPSVFATEGSDRRFRQEALALARLSHPHIAALFDIGRHDDVDYLVMECVPGQSLASRLDAGPLPVDEAVRLCAEVADALEEAKEYGVVHRDLKPANIIVTPRGHAKVLDFGLAKLLAPAGSGPSQSVTRGAVGTPFYMSPEQAFGEAVDGRSDLWSLGVVLYELLTGAPPFVGASEWAVIHAITEEQPRPVRAIRPEVPPAVAQIIDRALSKDVARRYQSPVDMAHDLRATIAGAASGAAAPRGFRAPRGVLVAAIAVVALLLGVAAWSWVGFRHRAWARADARAEVDRLVGRDRTLAAFLVWQRAERYLPSDTGLASIGRQLTRTATIESSPPGATVEVQDYVTPDSGWYRLGTTPMAAVRMPTGYLRWRLVRRGEAPYIAAPPTTDTVWFALDSAAAAPAGMVRVPAGNYLNFIAFLGWVGPFRLPAFDIDRFEVTNREFQVFVDSGGYSDRALWREPFVDSGRTLAWDAAMPRFRDRSGRPGPATWEGGHFPFGHGNDPVNGISWYEAAAYAEFVHAQLPTLSEWYRAAHPDLASEVVQVSNIGRDHLAPVGSFAGVGPYGTYDMAGNVREWVVNAYEGDQRILLGGAWTSQPYLFAEPEALSSFDRSPQNGLRCVRNLGPVPAAAAAPIRRFARDFSAVHPASDAAFHATEQLYSYGRTPLDARITDTLGSTPDWQEQRITFNVAYGHDRMAAYLFLPRRVRPPYQAAIFFPSARVLGMTDSRRLGDTAFFNFVVRSGRAVLYPVYQNTYERTERDVLPSAAQDLELTVEQFKDLARSIDYLATRTDIDTTRMAYLGVSMGAAQGVINATLLQHRLRTAVLLDGGFFLDQPAPGADQADFAPRLTIPVLMVNGRYDFSFPLDQSQLPLFRMLGTPPADKRHVLLDTPHDVSARPAELHAAVLAWLDSYLGRVK